MSTNQTSPSTLVNTSLVTSIIPPGPKGIFRIIDRMIAARDQLHFLCRSAQKYGNFVRLDPETYLINHPDLLEHIFTDTNSSFSKVKGHLGEAQRFWGNSLLRSEGEVWERQRRLIQPLFHHKNVAPY